jgi:cobalt/nickel transport system permease protein
LNVTILNLVAAGTAIGLKKIDYDHLGRVGILSATFFVASLVHVPIWPSSVHLILNGVVGLLLGWAAFPAILVALLLQAVFFQFGHFNADNSLTFNTH